MRFFGIQYMKQKQRQNDVFLGFELTEDEHGNKQYEIIFSVVTRLH